ncbi:STM3941 family protein [uncultured Dokdonia sp.]|uniref:STM3941 family protein n=1 Tax=uncultured Dokdonia sp. TaxID=575653 RepID=UPI002627B536|nr:STM3941 family protein [uncultured Dokdonia sp.]
MESKILRPKKTKSIILIVISILFVLGGYLMLEEKFFIGIITIIFFGLGIIIFTIQLFPNTSYLKLTKEGFEMRTLFKSNFTKWSDVKEFSTDYIGPNKMVMLNYNEEHTKYKNGKKIAKILSGSEGALPDTYGMSAKALTQLMNEWKAKHNM